MLYTQALVVSTHPHPIARIHPIPENGWPQLAAAGASASAGTSGSGSGLVRFRSSVKLVMASGDRMMNHVSL